MMMVAILNNDFDDDDVAMMRSIEGQLIREVPFVHRINPRSILTPRALKPFRTRIKKYVKNRPIELKSNE